jgi:hypothetical protein
MMIDELYAQLLQLSDELRSATLPKDRICGFCDFVILATSRWAANNPLIVLGVRRLLAGWARGPILSLQGPPLADYQRRMEFAYIRFDSVLSINGPSPFAESDPRTSWKTFQCMQFGVSLYECMWRQRRSHPSVPVPTIMLTLEEAIIAHGARETEGIFRLPGNMKRIDEVVGEINSGKRNWIDGLGTHDLVSLYARWIRIIPGHLIDVEKSHRIAGDADPFDIVSSLLPLYRNVLMHCVGFLNDLATAEPVTRMGVSNIALLLGSSVCAGLSSSEPSATRAFPAHAQAFLAKLMKEWDVSSMYPLTFW